MKKIMFFAAIIVCLSATYYFAIFLPKMHNFKMQEKCAKLAQEYFNNYGYQPSFDHATYECHYNRKINKCFILTSTDIFLDNHKTEIRDFILTDVLYNKVCGSYREDMGFPTMYIIDDKRCSSEEWHKRAKKYMEE